MTPLFRLQRKTILDISPHPKTPPALYSRQPPTPTFQNPLPLPGLLFHSRTIQSAPENRCLLQVPPARSSCQQSPNVQCPPTIRPPSTRHPLPPGWSTSAHTPVVGETFRSHSTWVRLVCGLGTGFELPLHRFKIGR
ncbi:hypothetical protein CRG98_030592 [Punica granatum]|uniref:Uncharacterized protein n=1 Tax=Punica granatum TaxID=22663 RepID=A0A2I0IYH4_PUNGR|nr:hypothetical protein CRG98_030592 [Punica granatum]